MKVIHHPALPYLEIGPFIKKLRRDQGGAARALEFTILTAGRTNEIIKAEWREFDLNTKTWTVPAERMKAKREHRIPLSDAAVAVLKSMQGHDITFVFPGHKREAASDTSRTRVQATTVEDVDALMGSVRQHLTHLLNARHGMSEALPDYGLPALTDFTVGTGDHVQMLQVAIKETIEKYEPRLRRVHVTHVVEDGKPADNAKFQYRVDAILVGKTGEHKVWWETSLSGGQFEVSD